MNKKFNVVLAMILILIMALGLLCACNSDGKKPSDKDNEDEIVTPPGDDGGEDETPETTYVLEAELATVEGTPNGQPQFVESAETASNGQSLGSLSAAGNKVIFTFTADKAATGTIKFFMCGTQFQSDMTVGDTILLSSSLAISLNGTALTYNETTFRGSGLNWQEPNAWAMYWDPATINETVNIIAGENTFVMESLDGAFPNLDKIEIITTAAITSTQIVAAQ